jgi:hypothetical protein
VTLFRIRWSTHADLPELTDIFARASLGAETTGDAPIGANLARFVRGASGVRAGGAPGT